MKTFLLLVLFFLVSHSPAYSHEGKEDPVHPATTDVKILADEALKSTEEIIQIITDALKEIKKQVQQSIDEIHKNVQP